MSPTKRDVNQSMSLKLGSKLIEPEFQAKFHASMTLLWILLAIPSFLWWKESLLWVIAMSLWANVAGHWSGYQAAHGEKRTKNQES